MLRRIVVTRNYLTHLDPEGRAGAARATQLVPLVDALNTVVQACLLLEIGFTRDEVKGILARRETYTTVSW